MAWLRLDEHLPENDKIRTLMRPEKVLSDFWILSLCIAKEFDGRFTNMKRFAFRMRIPETRVQFQCERLVTMNLMEKNDGVYSIHDWDQWQYKSDLSTERVKRHRERSRNGTETDGRNVSSLSSVSVSVSERETSKEQTADCGEPGSQREFLKNALASYFGGRMGVPDDGLVDLCFEASGGATAQEIQGLLRHLYQNQQAPEYPSGPRSWGWFPTVIRAHFAGRRQAN